MSFFLLNFRRKFLRLRKPSGQFLAVWRRLPDRKAAYLLLAKAFEATLLNHPIRTPETEYEERHRFHNVLWLSKVQPKELVHYFDVVGVGCEDVVALVF